MRKSVVLWVVSIGVSAAVSAGVTAQVWPRAVEPPRFVSGSDIGFRVEGQKQETRTEPLTGRRVSVDVVTGQLVVRVNDQWIEAELSGGRVRPLTN